MREVVVSQMSSPLVSICVTSYNHQNHVRAAVESAQQQTFSDWEMILIDDGSTDGTLDALKDICDERISIESFATNKTRCVALNQCLDKAKGRFLAILNSDDLWHPTKLERQLDIMQSRNQVGVVFSWVNAIDENGSDQGRTEHFHRQNRSRHEWLKYLLTEGTPFCHASALVRREVYEQVGRYDERLTQLLDFEQWIRTCEDFEVWIIPDLLTSERRMADQSNVSGDRPDAHARSNWERTLAYLEALRRNNTSLRIALADLGSVSDTSQAQSSRCPWDGEELSMETILLNLSIDDFSANEHIVQAFKIASALYLFQSLPANRPYQPPSKHAKKYHEWIKDLDPLRYHDFQQTKHSAREARRKLEDVKHQLDGIQKSLSWKLTAPFRRDFWKR
jgi:glycosyltransferase involved in cell wall biosynthesis